MVFALIGRLPFALLVLLVIPCPGKSQAPASCSVPEVIGYEPYDRFVCEGVAALDAGKHGAAVALFERALDLHFLDIPNFKLLPRLAVAQWKAGNRPAARRSLETARIALSVLVGVYSCVRPNDQEGFSLVDRMGHRVDGDHADEVMNRMCGEAYEYFYEPASLEAAVSDADLVRVYFDARELIEGR